MKTKSYPGGIRRSYLNGTLLIFASVVVLSLLTAWALWFDDRHVQPLRQYKALHERLKSLASRRPDDMSPRQWESAVAWTLNLHSNSSIMFEANGRKIRALNERIAKKLQGEVKMDTIYWIWDEYASTCPGGKKYQRFKEQMDDEISHGGVNWGLNIP